MQIECAATDSQPTRRRIVFRRTCPECQGIFESGRAVQDFCSVRCRNAWHNRAKTQGGRLIQAAKLWRSSRGGHPGSFQAMCAILDDLIREDRESGRPSVLPSVKAGIGR